MNTQLYGRIEFVISLTVVALILSACSLVGIESEPVIVQIEATAKAPEIVLPTPTQTEPMATATQIIQPTPTLAFEVTNIATTEPAASEVAVEATTGPPLLVDYGDEQTGISFTYPSNWIMEEQANAYIFRNEKVMLLIRYRSAGEQVDICLRTGIPAGDVVVLDDQVPFLGQTLTKNSLVYEDRLKAVFYGGHPISVVKSEGMEFTITLDDQESDYLTLDIPDDALEEAEAILSSLEIFGLEG